MKSLSGSPSRVRIGITASTRGAIVKVLVYSLVPWHIAR